MAKIDYTQFEKKKDSVDYQSFEKEKVDYSQYEKPMQGIDYGKYEKGRTLSRQQDFSEMSPFMKTLDIIDRPGSAIRNVAYEMAKEDKKLPLWAHAFGAPSKSYAIYKDPELRKAFMKGLKGKQRVTGTDIWKTAGVEGIPGLGVATEIALDPLMYGGYQAGTKALGKGIKGIGKGLYKIPAVKKGVQFTAKKAAPATATLKNWFVTKTGLKGLNNLIDKHLSKRKYLKHKELKFGIKTRNVIQNIAKKTGHSIDDVEKQVVNLIEQPHIIPRGVSKESIALANTIKSHLKTILTNEMKAGVPITSLTEGARQMRYFPRITSKEAVKYLKEARKSYSGVGKKVWKKMIKNAKARKTNDFTLQEFNDLVAKYGLKGLGGKRVEQYFIQNPAYALATRGQRAAKAITSANFLKEVGKKFGRKKAPSFWVELPNRVTKLNPSLKGLKFDPEVAGEIGRVSKQYINLAEFGVFRKIFDTVQSTWKRWVLAPFPKYHLRNVVGNTWNNFLANVHPKNYGRAQAIQMWRKYKGTGGKMENYAKMYLKKFRLAPKMADDIITKAEKTGVLGKGWYAADIDESIARQLAKGFKGLPLKTKLKKIVTGRIVIEKGMATGSTLENNARLAHFLDRLNKGDDALKAAFSVKKYLFDYQDLTHFEKQVMKRFLPFYTWTRKNIPLQVEHLYKTPQKYTMLSPLLRNRDPQDLLRLKHARPWLYERFPVEMKRDVDTVTYVPLEGLIPAGDLAKMVRPQEMLIELLTPYLRAPLELRMNKSFYFESEIQRYPEETQELLKMDIPVKIKYLATTVLPQARLLNEINKLVRKKVRKEEYTKAEQLFAQSLSSIYKDNLKDLRDKAYYHLKDKYNKLRQGYFWAKRYERKKEMKRIKETMDKVKKQLDKIK